MTESATIMRGVKIRLYPTPRQARAMDLWRRRTISLWNLLLSLEQAAYSGENIRPELRWRQIWAGIVTANYEKDVRIWQEGWQRKDGSWRKKPGEGKEPVPLDPDLLAKMQGKVGEDEPKIFLWERDLMAIMAALKREPLTQWIGDLPSHAAQAICKDLIRALQAMLRERKKRAAGSGRNTGFPKFKKSRYAAGAVYLANTQFRFDKGRAFLPNGVGKMPIAVGRLPDGKLMGGRVWREGEDWFLSAQFQVAKPEPLPETERHAGVKIGAAVLITTYDERGLTREYFPTEIDKRNVRRHKLAGRKMARRLIAHQTRRTKLAARKKNIHGGKMRLRKSKGFFECSERLAGLEAHNRNVRDDRLHKLTTQVVKSFGALQVQKMDVAKMMKKQPRQAQPQEEGANVKPRRSLKPVRVMLRQAAMARTRQLLAYKAADYGRDYAETDQLEPIVQACQHCGTLNPQMKDGRRTSRCIEPSCNKPLVRNRNAAGNEQRLLQQRRGDAACSQAD